MAKKYKIYIVVTYYHGTHELWSEDEESARHAALARGWWVKDIYEKEEEEKEKKAA